MRPPPPPHTTRTRGYLPHWESPNATYALTFRLADSLPQSILESYLLERDNILLTADQMNRPLAAHERTRLDELFSEKIEHYLDQSHGSCSLKIPAIANLVFNALQHFHNQRYTLHAACLMPNHVHALVQPHPPHALSEILHSWKSYTASEANKLLNQMGAFWMPESYDHLIRDDQDFATQQSYIHNNPRKAHLPDWPWIL